MGAVPASLVLVEVLGLGALEGGLQEELVGLPPLDGAVARVQLGAHPAAEGAPLLLPLDVVRALVLGEAPLLAHHHLLPPGELELGPTHRLDGGVDARVLAPHGIQDLPDGHPGAHALGLPEGPPHPRLQPVSPCASTRCFPAQESILLMRRTWKGCTRQRMWKLPVPAVLVRYLLQATRAASSASEEMFSFSHDTRCTHAGNASTS